MEKLPTLSNAAQLRIMQVRTAAAVTRPLSPLSPLAPPVAPFRGVGAAADTT